MFLSFNFLSFYSLNEDAQSEFLFYKDYFVGELVRSGRKFLRPKLSRVST